MPNMIALTAPHAGGQPNASSARFPRQVWVNF